MTGQSGEHTLPGTYLLHLATIAMRWQLDERELFEGTGLTKAALADPAFQVRLPVANAFAEKVRRMTGEPGIGILLGLQTYTSAHGHLGFAAMSAMTLRQAITLTVEYSPIRTTALAFELKVEGPRAMLVVHERADFGAVRDLMLAALLVGVWQIGNVLLGREIRESVVHLSVPAPEYYRRFQHLRPAIRFGQPEHALVFDAALLDQPLASADPASLRLLSEECDRRLRSLWRRTSLAERVQHLVIRIEGGLRSLDEVAVALGMSERTLRRRLADEETSFALLRDEALRERATLLLRANDMSVEQISQRLGYANLGNFVRAFRRWTGQTPTSFQKAESAADARAARS
ncbi:MAG TPA: AraC family transcriptional regulator [Polyangiaceae bacterium]|jgi:AraC-like DNA-binding protein|nr:AraC family transcriptional regulator [Polyangiaceae bacterium]